MTRFDEAKELRKQGFNCREIAKKMGIAENTARYYMYISRKNSNRYRSKYDRIKFGKKVRSIIIEELKAFGLPLEWEDELMRMFTVYHYSKGGRLRGRRTRIDIRSLIQLLCRRYKVPTPRKLEILTYKGGGVRKMNTSGYTDVLEILGGVPISKPIDYVKHFVQIENLPEEEILQAEELIEKIPKVYLQSRNPRVLAGAVLYEIHKPAFPTTHQNRIYTQHYIADRLQISSSSLRINWIKFFKSKQTAAKGEKQ